MTGDLVLDIERAVAGGRMLARHDRRVVFVAGAIPGERVRARIERTSRHAIWARTEEVIAASPDRRPVEGDPMCGGLAFAHIAYDRQLSLKSQILADAFRRLARFDVGESAVTGVVARHYRLRARLHVRDGRAGFFREGTHRLCDAASTRQVLPEGLDAAQATVRALGPRAADCEAIVVAENVAATERVLHLEPRAGARLDDAAEALRHLPESGLPVTGLTTAVHGRLVSVAGGMTVTDTAAALFGTGLPIPATVAWTRRPTSFFQGHRGLTGHLLRRVLDLVSGERIADLYAGVGLFAVALAARGARVLAVEGDRSAAADLEGNAAPYGDKLRVLRSTVEHGLRHRPSPPPDAVVVDPPRTGMSAEALDQLALWRAPLVVYVSCDPPTLARDAARLSRHGYRLISLEAVDLFPNTPHVEALAAFARP